MRRWIAEKRYNSTQVGRLEVVQCDAVQQSKDYTNVGQATGHLLRKAVENEKLEYGSNFFYFVHSPAAQDVTAENLMVVLEYRLLGLVGPCEVLQCGVASKTAQ